METAEPNRIQVSSSKKPLSFYTNLAKKKLQDHDEVVLSALGLAVSNMVNVAEILKKDGLVSQTKLHTSLDAFTDDGQQRTVQKPKMEVTIVKTADFHRIVAEQAASGAADAEA